MTTSQLELAAIIRDYLAELVDAGIADPLAEAFTLGAVLDDLGRLAGVPEAWPWPDASASAVVRAGTRMVRAGTNP